MSPSTRTGARSPGTPSGARAVRCASCRATGPGGRATPSPV
ncbi:hypothetical protein ACFVFH_21320 [Streptomyces sp. NPDC057697]